MRHHAVLAATCVTSALLLGAGQAAALGMPRSLANRVAVTAPQRKAWTGHVTAAGGVNFDDPTRNDMKGKSGTVWLSKAA